MSDYVNNKQYQQSQEQNLQSQKHSIHQPQHPMMKLLIQYNKKLTIQQESYKQKLSSIKIQIKNSFQHYLQNKFNKFENQFMKDKQQFIQQKTVIQYYLQNFIQKHSLNPKQNNLYPLFNQIDNKINQNHQYLEQKFTFTFNYPQQKKHIVQKAQEIKLQILTKQLNAIKQYLGQNQNFNKYCKKEINKIQEIHKQYDKLLQMNEQQVYKKEIQFVGSYQQFLLVLQMNPKIQKLSLSIRSQNGKLSIEQYKQIFSKLSQSKNLLTELKIKFMDMEFQQLKCNEIKMFIKQLKYLKTVKIQNYFKENKLGVFEQFNWLPLKKQTHVVGKKW